MPHLPPPDIARARRRVLKGWLRTAPLEWRELATLLGYELGYFRDLLTGRLPISDSCAWRLQYRGGVPLHTVEPPPLVAAATSADFSLEAAAAGDDTHG